MARTKAMEYRNPVLLLACTAACIAVAAADGPCEISGGYNYKRLSTTMWLVSLRDIGPCVTIGARSCSWTLKFCSNEGQQPPCGKDAVCEAVAPNNYTHAGSFRTLVPNGPHSFVAKFEEPGAPHLKCKDVSKTLKMNFIFTCDPQKHLPIGPGSVVTKLDYSTIDDKHECQRNITVPYDGACGTAPPSGGISTGTLLLILFFVALLIYLLGGILINRHNGAEGLEMIPHLQFWKELPALIVEGSVFFVQLVTCQGGGSSRTYDNI